MSAWIVVFSQRSLAEVTPDQILAGIDEADWWTLAEGYGIEDEAVVDSALEYLRIKEIAVDPSGRRCYELSYRPPGRRQVRIEHWTDPALVAAEVQQSRDELAGVRKPRARVVREHLGRVRETIGIELGWLQLEDMAVVLAYEVARWLAHVGKGLVEDHDGGWWRVTCGGAYKPLLP